MCARGGGRNGDVKNKAVGLYLYPGSRQELSPMEEQDLATLCCTRLSWSRTGNLVTNANAAT